MADNINIVDGKAAFASAKEVAWHGLGQVVDHAMTSKECIELAGLDYEVGLAPLYARVNEANGTFDSSLLDKNFATYRKDTNDIFGVVGSKYTVVQNIEAFDFFDGVVGEGSAIFQTAGALGIGETVFITAKLPDYIRIGNSDDVIEKYLLLTMSHDGSGAIQAMFTPVRVVCNNTLQSALRNNTNKISIRHTKSAQDTLKDAYKIMGMTNKLTDALSDKYTAMSKFRFDTNQTGKLIEQLYLSQEELADRQLGASLVDVVSTKKNNVINDIIDYTYNNDTQKLVTTDGTLWGCYNGLTGYYQNVKTYKSDEAKFKSNLLGTNKDIMQKALNLCNRELELA